MNKNEENPVKEWYESLPRTKKSKLLLHLQMNLGRSQSCIYDRLGQNNWSKLEREYVTKIKEDGRWDN